MKKIEVISLIALFGLVGCASTPKQEPHISRSMASVNALLSDPVKLDKKIEKLTNGIYHGYMMGQVHLNEFDKELDVNPSKVMKSKAYHSLLSVRVHVDEFEHELSELYTELFLVTHLSFYSHEKKKDAQEALGTLNQFVEGLRPGNKEIPKNLRPLVLGNLHEKIGEIHRELKIDSLSEVRLSEVRDLSHYQVDESVLKMAIEEEKKKSSYKELKKQIQSMSEEMKTYTSEMGRDTSSDSIAPSAGPSGNISGKNFPANTWSLTYDDGPAKTTPEVIKNLKAKKIPATFFMLAQQVKSYPATAKELKNSGFDLASHSYTHAQLTKVGPAQLEKEIGTSKSVIENQLGVKVKLFRLPYGAGVSVSSVRAKIAEHKMIHVFWTVDTLDWQDKNPQSVFKRTIKQMNASGKNAGIILFHDIHKQSVTASTMLMDYFNEKKLTVCTVQGVVDQINNGTDSCK